MRRCTPTFDIETMIEACGTPWSHNQKQVVTIKPRQRLPPHRGIEALPPAPGPRSPSQQAASDPTSSEGYQPSMDGRNDDDDDDDDDDGGEMEMMKIQAKELRERQQALPLEEPIRRKN